MTTEAQVEFNGKVGTQTLRISSSETLLEFVDRLHGYLSCNKDIWRITIILAGEPVFVVCLFGRQANR